MAKRRKESMLQELERLRRLEVAAKKAKLINGVLGFAANAEMDCVAYELGALLAVSWK